MILLYLIFSKFDVNLFMQSVQPWPPTDDLTQLILVEDLSNPAFPCRIECIKAMTPFENFFLQIRNILVAICLELVTPIVNGYFIVRNFYFLYYYNSIDISVDAFTYGNLLAKEHFEVLEMIKETFRRIEWEEHSERRPFGKYLVFEFGFAVVYAEYAVWLLVLFFVYHIYDHPRPFVDGPGAAWTFTCFLYLINYCFLGFLCYLFPCGTCYTYTDFIFLNVVSYISIIGCFVAFPLTFLYFGYRHLALTKIKIETPDEFMFSFARNLFAEDASDLRALRPPFVNRDINTANSSQKKVTTGINKEKLRHRVKAIKYGEEDLPHKDPTY